MPTDIVAFAESLIDRDPEVIAESLVTGGPEVVKVIKIYWWKGDNEAHDDAFQDRTHDEFAAIHRSLVEELSNRFGEPRLAESYDEFDAIPMNGVFPAAMWETGDTELFLAVSHEDRECPLLLAIGIM